MKKYPHYIQRLCLLPFQQEKPIKKLYNGRRISLSLERGYVLHGVAVLQIEFGVSCVCVYVCESVLWLHLAIYIR